MPTPDKNLASEMAKIVPREDAAKDSATVDRTTPRQEAAKDSATVDRMPRRQEAAKNSAAVDLTTPRQKEAKDIAALDRTTPHANAPRSPTVAAAAPAPRKPVPSLSIAVPLAEPFPAAPVAPNAASSAAGNAASSAAGNAASLAAPNAASSAAGNAASSAAPNAASRAATRVASAPAAEKVAAPAPPTEAPRAPAVAQSAFAGRMTMKGEAGGSAIVLIEPGQPGGPPAAAQGVPQGTAARASPQVTMAKVPTRENLADAARTNEMARERDAERPVAKGRISDRAPLPVAEWIALIRRLRDEGKAADAARELAAFRAAHVDHGRLLPRDLVDWRPPAQ